MNAAVRFCFYVFWYLTEFFLSAVMKLNNRFLELNATPVVVHGVELSKDLTGVTAKMSTDNHKVSVLFDGTTAQIHMTGKYHSRCNISMKFSSVFYSVTRVHNYLHLPFPFLCFATQHECILPGEWCDVTSSSGRGQLSVLYMSTQYW